MTRRRWLADEVRGDKAALTGKHAEHLGRVLRARVGQEFEVSAGGRLRRGRVVAVEEERVERWRRIAQEAAEQSRRLAPLEILAPMRLKDAVATSALTRVVLAESEQAVSLADVVRVHPPGESLALAVGPEGGWTEDELRLFAESGWTAASLGQRILRAETAAIAAMAIVTSSAP